MAGVVQQTLSDLLPDGLLAVQTNRVSLLDLGRTGDRQRAGARTAEAPRPSHRFGVSREIVEDGAPIFLRDSVLRAMSIFPRVSVTLASFFTSSGFLVGGGGWTAESVRKVSP
ncbi:hypothetical protein ASG57_35840 [Bradyrhizobium sp. Leaf396]|nr:hypothetical protein ASG57_35840 [Bradyrhizobium sp. Leaf396]